MDAVVTSIASGLRQVLGLLASPLALGLIAGACIGTVATRLFLARNASNNMHSSASVAVASSVDGDQAVNRAAVLDTLLDTLQVGLRCYDLKSETITYVSPSFAELWQSKASKLRGASSDWLKAVHEDDRDRIATAWAASLAGEPYDETYRISRSDTSQRWIHEQTFRAPDANGADGELFALATDVTVRRELESHVRRGDRIFSLGKVATGVAHDLGDPLATIVLLSRLALHDQDDSEEKDRSLRRIRSEALRCSQITRGLLQFARDDTFEKEYAELNSTARDASRLLAQHTKESGAIVNLLLEKNLPALRINQVAIQQTLINLLKNSCDAGAKRIDVSTSRTAGGYELAVEDNGAGINTVDAERIFEPFYTTRAKSGGSGLGLAVVKDIVADHGGLVRVELPPAGGTRVVVAFPKSIGRREQSR